MYEDKSAAKLHEEVLEQIDDSYQKTVGYPTFDLTKAFALVLAPMYEQLGYIAGKLDIEQLQDDELTRFVYQRKGVERKEATYSHGMLKVSGNGTVNIGDLFESDGGVQFAATETKQILGEGFVNVQAITAGPAGNVGAGSVTMMPKTLPGITTCTNPEPMLGGYNAETDDSLRERYYEAIRQPPTSGNKYHYLMWAREVAGVGDAKVFPLWQGDNTVLVVIINDNKLPADDELVARVQAHIDPDSTGRGEGQAPIGAYCTVQSAQACAINITLKVMPTANYSATEVQANIRDAVAGYLQSIAFTQDYVSYGKVVNAINDAAGVADFSDLLLNGGISNVAVSERQVAVVGEVVVDAV
nr:MAG TPA: Baseplate J like protein [Caudoviricetes sp.]